MKQKAQGLKKEFQRKDVERVRNLVRGKANDSAETQVGYSKKKIDYKEGDVWKENRKTWTIKNGIKQTISKLDAIKKQIFMPLCCPKCSKVMKHSLDKDNYKVHKKCLDCVIEFEHKLKIKGKYQDYINDLQVKNNLTILEETESYLLDVVNRSNSGYVSEDGVIEKWVGGVDKVEFTKKVKEAAKEKKEWLNKKINDKKRA
jgi:hypothetical protein